MWQLFTIIIAVIFLIWRVIYPILHFLYLHVLHPRCDFSKYGSNEHAFAVVTGASDGIGRAFAIQLAKRGFDLYLISRTREKLDRVADEIRQLGRQAKTFTIDFTQSSKDFYPRIEEELRVLNVRVLINNAGGGIPPVEVKDITRADVFSMMDLNIATLVEFTWMMLRRKHEKRGLILNVGSFTAEAAFPMATMYAAGKRYMRFFTEAVSAEMRGVVDVYAVEPMFVQSNAVRKPVSWTVPSAMRFAGDALDLVGCGQTVYCPYWVHDASRHVLAVIPGWVKIYLVMQRMKQMQQMQQGSMAD